MLPPEHNLEVRTRLPQKPSRKPPLLFVHGGFCDSWCWEPYFLPWFAARGYPSHALSLRGHGASGGKDSMFVAGLDDYAADVEHISSRFATPPVLIGHSMGAAVIERMMSTRPLRAAALLAPLPPGGLGTMMSRLAAQQPEYIMRMQSFDPRVSVDMLHALRPMYFSDGVSPALLAQSGRHLGPESPRALLDLTLRLHGARPVDGVRPLVIGAQDDRVCSPSDVAATATLYGVKATMLPGLAHMMMLEPDYEQVARALLAWLDTELDPKG